MSDLPRPQARSRVEETQGRPIKGVIQWLMPHCSSGGVRWCADGGDLQGFALLRGSEEQMGALRADEEFQRRVLRADQIIESQGVIDALIGEGIARGMTQYQGEIDDLD